MPPDPVSGSRPFPRPLPIGELRLVDTLLKRIIGVLDNLVL